MLQRLTNDETNTFDEVNKALNMLIDNLNLVEAKVLVLDKPKGKKKAKKKGDK